MDFLYRIGRACAFERVEGGIAGRVCLVWDRGREGGWDAQVGFYFVFLFFFFGGVGVAVGRTNGRRLMGKSKGRVRFPFSRKSSICIRPSV